MPVVLQRSCYRTRSRNLADMRRMLLNVLEARRCSALLPAHRLAGREIDEMDPHASRAGEGLEVPPLDSLLLLQMSLHIHARLGASKNDQIGHRRSMAGSSFSSLI